MINKIEIKNIQSHKHSILKFSKGINVLCGTSNNGKSAVLRALNFAINNRPLGIDTLLSSWSYDKKGKQIEEMSVTVKKGNSILKRTKSKDENTYTIDNEVLEAIKTDVPEQVEKFFNLSEVNFQKQMDSPFLLSLSSGEVAKFFNKIVRLDIIDKILSTAEQTRRKTKNNIELKQGQIEKLEKELENFSWIDNSEKLLIKVENISNKNNKIKTELENINTKLNEYKNCRTYDFEKEKNIISKIESLQKSKEQLISRINHLSKTIEEYKNCKTYDFEKEKKLIKKIESFDISEIDNNCKNISKSINEYKNRINTINECKETIKENKNKLPNACPLCGGKLENGVCTNEN